MASPTAADSGSFPLPDSTDLYALLSLTSPSTPSAIKAAYRRAALLCHPDRLPPTASPADIEAANAQFQKVGFAYAVLKDDVRRERYDRDGTTEEGGVGRSEKEWKDYFKELWKGEVNGLTLDQFKAEYQGSEEEKGDVYAAYEKYKGDLEGIVITIMCSTVDDEDRFIILINDAIEKGELKETSAWKKSAKDTKAKEKRRVKADKEAGEAEAYAKELGVHDKLFGEGRKAKGKGKGKGKGEVDDEAGLRALIQGNQAKRMGSIIDSLEARYGKKQEAKAKKGEEEGGSRKKRKVESEPSEEEFERIQAGIDARRTSNGSAQEAKVKKRK